MREASSVEEVFARHVGPVYRLFYSWVGNREDAEDLTSKTFSRVARHRDQPRPTEGIDAWIFTTGRHVLADHWRRCYHENALPALDEDGWEGTSGQGEPPSPYSEADQLVKTILAGLPDRDRRILELRFLHGSSVKDAAQELGITPEHALVLQRRALAEALRVAELRDSCDETALSRG